jgi:hypothetical protein
MRVLEALKWQIERDRLADFAQVVHADLFADLLAQSEHLLTRATGGQRPFLLERRWRNSSTR